MPRGPYGSERAAVAAAARRLADAGLLIGTAGNGSARLDGGRIAVTATGVVLADCTADAVTVVDGHGTVLAGDLAPTSELELHLGLRTRGAVVHTHAPWATALACVLEELPVLHYQQLLLGGSIAVAPYATFGTAELAASVSVALADRQAALMANHGSVAVGETLDQAVDNALLLEWLCQLHHRASALGTPSALTAEQQAAVVEQAVRQRYGSPRPAHEEDR
jgi:L-fuculose-phosphate aldolase